MAKPDDTDKLFDDLVRGKSPEELLGKNGLIKSLTKRVVEHALKAEMTEHLGYEKHSLAALQEILGHASIVTTQRYARLGEAHVKAEARRVFGDGG